MQTKASLFFAFLASSGLTEVAARRDHGHLHAGSHLARIGTTKNVKRSNQCQFPTDCGLVAITPNEENAGWAMSPDQPCKPGNYCPYACPPGQVMAQWNPLAISYVYPLSMDGGLYCDEDGNISKPFPEKDYCVDAKGPVAVQNNAKGVVSFCQTVLPGNEAMLIPTSIEDFAELAVPDTSYWCETAAHFYINPPGVGTDEACIWGTNENPVGNWSPYVAGANKVANGETFIKLGWNPIYLETTTPFRDEVPTWGVEIQCEGGGCNGLPCAIDPSTNGVNEMNGDSSIGAGGAAFCVVTVPEGSTANFVVFEVGGDDSSSDSYGAKSSASSSTKASSTTSSAATSSTEATTSSAAATTSSTSTSSTTSSATSSSQSSSAAASSSATFPSYAPLIKAKFSANSTSAYYPTGTNAPHVFLAQATTTGLSAAASGAASGDSSSSDSDSSSSDSKIKAANSAASGLALSSMSLFVALLASAFFLN